MFGSLAFLVNGKMCVAVGEDRIMFRIDPDAHDAVLARTGCEPVVMRGRTMRGYMRVGASDLNTHSAFDEWINLAVTYTPTRRNGSPDAAFRAPWEC